MEKVLFGVFAHPDDENGPSGTLITSARQGVDVHLVCLTRGEAGTNIDNHADLGAVRFREWQTAGRLIGATSLKQFNFGDGQLRNHIYHDVAKAVEQHIKTTLEGYSEPLAVEFMTFDKTGLTGHLDHVAASLITTYVFARLREGPGQPQWQFQRLRYFNWPPSKLDHDVSFVYFPPGLKPDEADEIVDVSSVYEDKLAVMQAHQSQRSDAAMLLETFGEQLKQELFRFFEVSDEA